MGRVKIPDVLMRWLKTYKYVVLILALGIVLMLLPGKPTEAPENTEPAAREELRMDISQELAQLLSRIEGAGKVEVMLTVALGEETVFQTNEAYSTGTDTGTTEIDTVIISDSRRNQAGLIRQVNPVKYRGAIVVCQGAENPAVRLMIVEAVSNITGLGSDKISVLKMK